MWPLILGYPDFIKQSNNGVYVFIQVPNVKVCVPSERTIKPILLNN